MHDTFIRAIHDKKKLRITFFSIEDGRNLVRTCAPMDYGPSRRTASLNDRYHFWDYDSDTGKHTLSLNPDQLLKIDPLEETFEPGEFVTWNTRSSPWFVRRDWGLFS